MNLHTLWMGRVSGLCVYAATLVLFLLGALAHAESPGTAQALTIAGIAITILALAPGVLAIPELVRALGKDPLFRASVRATEHLLFFLLLQFVIFGLWVPQWIHGPYVALGVMLDAAAIAAYQGWFDWRLFQRLALLDPTGAATLTQWSIQDR